MASGGRLRTTVGKTRCRRYRPGGVVRGPTRTGTYSSVGCPDPTYVGVRTCWSWCRMRIRRCPAPGEHSGPSSWRWSISAALVLAIGPAAVAYVVLKVISDADEGANIGGGLLVIGIFMLGSVLAIVYLGVQCARVIRSRRR